MRGDLAAWLGLGQAAVFFTLTFFCAFTDLKSRRIQNLPCGLGVACGLALAYVRGGGGAVLADSPGLLSALGGLGTGFILFYPAYAAGGLGAGDVKLLAALGALTNLRFIAWTAAGAAGFGMILAMAMLIQRGELWRGVEQGLRLLLPRRRTAEETKQLADRPQLPYAVPIALGGWTAVAIYVWRGWALPFF